MLIIMIVKPKSLEMMKILKIMKIHNLYEMRHPVRDCV